MKISYEFTDESTIRITMTCGDDTCVREIDLTQQGEMVSLSANRYAMDMAVIEAAIRDVKFMFGDPDFDDLIEAIKAHPDYKGEE
jgi:hypothetical protein